MKSGPELRIAGERVTIFQGGLKTAEASVPELVERVRTGARRRTVCDVLPAGTRAWIEQGDVVATCIEVAPDARTVFWIADDSPAPRGEDAKYERRFLAFPYIEILLVFRRGALTGAQQLYYRRRPLDADGALDLCNMLNVSPDSYAQRAWLCLATLGDVSRFGWQQKIDAVVEHVFCAGFNLSSDLSEGSSYWSQMRDVDPRVATVQAWEQASRENRRFALDVAWTPAGTTVTAELEHMLGLVAPEPTLETAEDVCGAVAQARARSRRRRCFPFM